MRGTIAVTYATTLTGWHGNKALGFTITCDDESQRVGMSAPDTHLDGLAVRGGRVGRVGAEGVLELRDECGRGQLVVAEGDVDRHGARAN